VEISSIPENAHLPSRNPSGRDAQCAAQWTEKLLNVPLYAKGAADAPGDPKKAFKRQETRGAQLWGVARKDQAKQSFARALTREVEKRKKSPRAKRATLIKDVLSPFKSLFGGSPSKEKSEPSAPASPASAAPERRDAKPAQPHVLHKAYDRGQSLWQDHLHEGSKPLGGSDPLAPAGTPPLPAAQPRTNGQEARNRPNIDWQEKIHRGILRGLRNSSETP
jgi:hypothetical protein